MKKIKKYLAFLLCSFIVSVPTAIVFALVNLWWNKCEWVFVWKVMVMIEGAVVCAMICYILAKVAVYVYGKLID